MDIIFQTLLKSLEFVRKYTSENLQNYLFNHSGSAQEILTSLFGGGVVYWIYTMYPASWTSYSLIAIWVAYPYIYSSLAFLLTQMGGGTLTTNTATTIVNMQYKGGN